MKKTAIPRVFIVIAIIFFVAAVLNPIVVYRFFHPPNRRDVIDRVFKDWLNQSVMMDSPEVTAQRLHRKPDGDPDHLSGYERDAPVTLTPTEAWRIKSLLREPSSYLWDARATCTPDYGMVYNFQCAGHSVHAAFCLKCNIIGIFDSDNDASNRVNFTSQFNPMRGQIVTLSKALFPNDGEMQALK